MMGTQGSWTYALLTQWGFSAACGPCLDLEAEGEAVFQQLPTGQWLMDGDGEEETHLWAGSLVICGGEETIPEGEWSFSSWKKRQQECEDLHVPNVLLPSRTWMSIAGS